MRLPIGPEELTFLDGYLFRVMVGILKSEGADASGLYDFYKARIEQELGLDRSLPMQYAAWIGGIVQGDLGFSYVSEKSAWAEIAPRIPVSARLAGTALLFAIASLGAAPQHRAPWLRSR